MSDGPLAAALQPHGVEVLYADPSLAIVDKPCGLASQRTAQGEPGLIDLLWEAGFSDAALHHRLDQPASGCLAVAMSAKANPGLANVFRDRTASRIYRVTLMGPLRQSVVWDAPLDGLEARTEVRPLAVKSGFTAAEVRLHTGRTHQIRKHAAMAGLPVVGDHRYGAEAGRAWPRLALHAWSLSLPHPIGGQTITARSEIPQALKRLWQIAGGP